MKNHLRLKPLVSICIPTYNGSKFILEALRTAIEQTYTNIEIIVSDDASKDNTLELIREFQQTSSIPILVYHHEPSGIGANWNNCIKKAKGKYIKFLFQDDLLMHTCIEEMVHVLENDNTIGLVASKRTFIIETSFLSETTSQWIKRFGDLQAALQLPLKNGMHILDKTLFKSEFFLKQPLNKVGEPPVTLFRKNIINQIGYFREDLAQVLDYEFYYRILKTEKIAILEKELVKFRLHGQQATNVNKGKYNLDFVKYRKIIYDDYFWHLNTFQKKEFLKEYHPILKKTKTLFKYLSNIKNKLHL